MSSTKQEAVGVLRRGGCYTECNRRACILEVVHELHQAQFHAFLELCRKEPAIHHALHLAKVTASSVHVLSGSCLQSYQQGGVCGGDTREACGNLSHHSW